MNNITNRHLFIIGLLVFILATLFYYGRSINLVKHDKVLHLAHDIIEDDAELTEKILIIRIGLLRHYDDLNEILDDIRIDFSELKVLINDINSATKSSIFSRLNRIEIELDSKELLVEKFKSTNSILRNSLMYFTLSTSRLGEEIKRSEKTGLLFQHLGLLSIRLLQYYRNPNDKSKLLLDGILSLIDADRQGGHYGKEVNRIINHGKLVSNKIQESDEILDQIRALPLSEHMYQIVNIYLNHHKSIIARSNTARLMTTFVASLLVFYLIYLLTHLRRRTIQLARANTEIAKEKELAEITLGSIADAVITTDDNTNIAYMNPMAEHLTGWDFSDANNMNVATVFKIVDLNTKHAIKNLVRYSDTNQFSEHECEYVLIDKTNNECIIRLRVAPIRDEKLAVYGSVIVFQDISVTHKLVEHISHQARHDELTGLLNRREFEKRLHNIITESDTHDTEHAMCFLDLDQFKIVNDTCGHIAGDELLKQLAVILSAEIRASDTLSRLGGDEFGLLLHHCTLKQAKKIAEQFRDTIENFRFSWKDKVFDLGVSIGLVAIRPGACDMNNILSQADIACYAAKEHGRNRVHVYSETDLELQKRHKEMHTAATIKQAIAENRFVLYCQLIRPIHELAATTEITEHYEILIRLKSEDDQILPPGAFIPAAERYDLMNTIDKWVINESFKLLSGLNNNDNKSLTYEFSINLSGNTICDEGLKEFITEKQLEYNINPKWVCFEVTETSAVANLNDATVLIKKLKKKGFRFSLDDFGSGMSSFTYLKTLDVDFLKIDGSFVRGIVHDDVDYAMVESINHIGQVMGMSTIAEFVENDAILEKLKNLGVNYAQGFGIDKPKPVTNLFK